jgi:hypothetical protein
LNKWQNAAAMQKYAVEANIIVLSEADSCLPQLTQVSRGIESASTNRVLQIR